LTFLKDSDNKNSLTQTGLRFILKVTLRKTQIVIVLGMLWFALSPGFFYFSTLNDLYVKVHPCFEKSDLAKSVFDLETSKKTFTLAFIIHRVLRSESLLLTEVSRVFPQVFTPNLNFLMLRC